MIIKYIVIHAPSIIELEQIVMQKIKEGYILQGGVSIAIGPVAGILYTQAMIEE